MVPLADAVAGAFPRLDVDETAAADVRHGRPLPLATGSSGADHLGPVGVFGPDGAVLAVMSERDGLLRPLVVLAPA